MTEKFPDLKWYYWSASFYILNRLNSYTQQNSSNQYRQHRIHLLKIQLIFGINKLTINKWSYVILEKLTNIVKGKADEFENV